MSTVIKNNTRGLSSKVIGRTRNLAQRAISKNRRSAPIQLLHSLSSFVESAYRNEGSDIDRNGELRLMKQLSLADFKMAFDVGANLGDWLLHALESWPQCHCHAFEVAPPTFQRLA